MHIVSFKILNKLVHAKHRRIRKLANSVKPYEDNTHSIKIEVIRKKILFEFVYKKASRKLYLIALAKLA